MKILALLAMAILLSACGDADKKQADGKILCDNDEGKAYFVSHHIGNTSIIEPVPMADKNCDKGGL